MALSKAFNTWVEHVEELKYVRACDNYMQRTYRYALDAWQQYVWKNHSKRRNEAAAIAFCRNVLLRNAIYTWQRHVIMLARLRVAVSG